MRIGYDHLTDELLNNEIIKLLLNYTNLGIIICDKFGVIQAVNDYSSNVLGFKVDEIVHQKLDKILSVSISDENETNYNLEDLLLKTSAPFSKAILMDGRTKGGETIKLKTHIDTMILEGEFSLLCFFENDQESKDLSQFTKKFNATFCQNEGGDEKFDCQVMKNLMQANTELSNEIDISHNLNTNFEEALLIEKKHSEFTTRFVSIASHEFRTPLSGILTSASLLEKYNEQGYEEQRLRHIKIIKGQVRNLIGILNDFLTFDSLDRPEVSVKIKMFCIKDFFYDYLHSDDIPEYFHKRINYQHVGDVSLVYQAPELIKKIVNNIVANAMKYSKEDSSVEIISEIQNKNLKILIKDKGIGIPEDEQSHILELFYRAENTAGIQGTGLGLNIAKLCLDLIHGKMEFESIENEGSTFTINIPKDLEK